MAKKKQKLAVKGQTRGMMAVAAGSFPPTRQKVPLLRQCTEAEQDLACRTTLSSLSGSIFLSTAAEQPWAVFSATCCALLWRAWQRSSGSGRSEMS